MPPIIDMRNRPTWLHPFFGAAPGTPDYDVVRWLNRRVGSADVDHFTRAPDLPAYLAEIEAAGIAHAFMVGRSTPTVRIANDELADLVGRSGGKLSAALSVDPVELGAEAAAQEADRLLATGSFAALNVDGGFYARPLQPDDPLLLPLYEVARARKVPAFVMSGPTTPDLAYNDPRAVGRLAALFKDLPLIVSHGLYPNVAEAVTIAFRHENVVLSPRHVHVRAGWPAVYRGGQRLHGRPVPVRHLLPLPRHAPERRGPRRDRPEAGGAGKRGLAHRGAAVRLGGTGRNLKPAVIPERRRRTRNPLRLPADRSPESPIGSGFSLREPRNDRPALAQ